MSLLLIWIWIDGNCESCPLLTCPLSTQAAFKRHQHTISLIPTTFCFLFVLPSSKSTYIMDICIKSVSALQLWWLYVSDNALTTPSFGFLHNVSLSDKTVSYSLLCPLVWAHGVHRNTPLSSSGFEMWSWSGIFCPAIWRENCACVLVPLGPIRSHQPGHDPWSFITT